MKSKDFLEDSADPLKFLHNPRHTGIQNALVFFTSFLISIWILYGEWAKNDDYIDLGMFSYANWNFKTAFPLLLERPAAAGRPLHAMSTAFVFPHFESVNQLGFIRILEALAVAAISTVVFQKISKVFESVLVGLIASGLILFLPGTWAISSFTSTLPFLIVTAFLIYTGDIFDSTDL